MSDLTQEQLMNYVDLAIKALTPTFGHRMMLRDIQLYLRSHYGIEETLWRIKEAETAIYELQEAECLHNFWTTPPDVQARLSVKYGELPMPLTDEEKQEMEGCGC